MTGDTAAALASTPTSSRSPSAKSAETSASSSCVPASNTTLFSTLLGPRIALHPKIVPLNPYAEFLFGAGHFSYGNNSPSTTQFDWRVLGGLDKTLLPHLDWRVIEVSYGQLNTYSGRLRPVTFSTGIVLRLH